MDTFPLIMIEPFPVVYALLAPAYPRIIPPVGKSGPGMIFIISSIEAAGFSKSKRHASVTSLKL